MSPEAGHEYLFVMQYIRGISLIYVVSMTILRLLQTYAVSKPIEVSSELYNGIFPP